ncbi:phospho-N-acetylmuramoyl-pentapeptide-transferase [Portibacter marinus]|uniref:phospho-N-acetylmuramoyl-pentapeptide- transferase n=1 Tax=Portibacter marinus TaxID=2898660 RepID=UPI001F16613C|nr:phospho-N-acetylmuramoyl-pentapeptide-transferase [Portibacter marinus]
MFYYLFEYLQDNFNLPGAGLFTYISFRSGLAILLSLLISMLFGNRIISSLKKLQLGETVRDLGLKGQLEKAGTPTMGGVIIIMATLVPVLLLCRLGSVYILLMLAVTIWLGTIGFIDDYIKVVKKNKAGLAGKYKVIGQVGIGLIVGLTMLYHPDITVRVTQQEAIENNYEIMEEFTVRYPQVNQTDERVQMAYVKTTLTNVPFIKGNKFDYAALLRWLGDHASKFIFLLFVPIIIFIVTAVSNGANLTDGLDGLATGVSAIIGATLGVLAYVSGNTIIADYLNILYIPGSEELVIFAAGFLGACVGFLWFNSYPAKVFMGDTGSLAIGGIIAVFAILIRKELLIPILCGIFLAETASVILQVSYFKYTKRKYGEGRRIFKMSPLHHHFQKLGMHEARIVTRFWIVGIMLAILTIITLKMR